MKLGSLLYVRCRHRSVKSRALRSNKGFPICFIFQLTKNADSYGIVGLPVNRYVWILTAAAAEWFWAWDTLIMLTLRRAEGREFDPRPGQYRA